MNITFTVPGEPQGKGRARISTRAGFARAYTPPKTVAYESLAALAASQAMRGQPPVEFPCYVEIRITHSIPASWSKKKQDQARAGDIYPVKKPDADNVMKAIYDAMNGIVWKDDVQAVRNFVYKIYGLEPGVYVSVEPIA